MIQSFSEALAPRSRVSVGSAVCSTVMSTTMRKTALDTIARMAHRPAPETFIRLLYTPKFNLSDASMGASCARIVRHSDHGSDADALQANLGRLPSRYDLAATGSLHFGSAA